jgi:hypothetical protein
MSRSIADLEREIESRRRTASRMAAQIRDLQRRLAAAGLDSRLSAGDDLRHDMKEGR